MPGEVSRRTARHGIGGAYVRPNLREQVTEAIQSALVSGEMQPDVIYSAPALAERFGVSATPVREALLDLAREGYVEPIRNRGFRVVPFSEKDLDEVLELRILLEVPTIAGLARTATPGDLAPLRPLAKEIEQAARAGDLIAYLNADRHFHLALLELTGNTRLVATVGRLRAQARLYGLAPLREQGRLLASAREHRALLKLIGSGDEAGARQLMAEHVRHTRGIWAGKEAADHGDRDAG